MSQPGQPSPTPTRHLILPTPNAPGEITTLNCSGSVVVVGANGAGKTRLGSWLELSSEDTSVPVHRVSAQRVLNLPEGVNIQALDQSRKQFLYGSVATDETHSREYKRGGRWGNKPDTFQLNDYTALLSYLFAEDADVSTRYRQESLESGPRPAPTTKLDAVRRIFTTVLPHRQVFASGGQVMAEPADASGQRYNAAQMSDGERVVFYLVGACMAAPEGAVIIIDEPEIHLHKSVQGLLWDAIERERPDCLFVYLTHDLDFAASRAGATKVWLRGYRAGAAPGQQTWDWALVPEQDALPEALLLELIGSRRPVLFTEGQRGGLDDQLFTALLPNYAVTPVGGCEQVIHITHSFAGLHSLHHLACQGIVDRDARDQGDVDRLLRGGVHTLDVSEIENLFLIEPWFRAVAARLAVRDVEGIVARVKDNVLNRLQRERERVTSTLTATRIEAAFKTFDAKAQGAAALNAALTSVVGAVDVPALFQTNLSRIDDVLARSDFDSALALYNNKGLMAEAAQVLGLRTDGYLRMCLDRLADPAEESLRTEVRARLGGLC